MFENNIDSNYTADHTEIPKESAPTTRDNNVIYVDPFPGPYSPPNPLMPKNWPKDLRVSFNPSDPTKGGADMPGSDTTSQHLVRQVSSATTDNNRRRQPSPSMDTSGELINRPVPSSFTAPLGNPADRYVSSAAGNWLNSPAVALVAGNLTRGAAPDVSASAPPLTSSNELVGDGLADWIAALAGHPFSTR